MYENQVINRGLIKDVFTVIPEVFQNSDSVFHLIDGTLYIIKKYTFTNMTSLLEN